MSEVHLHPLEAVLRLCAQADPQPWFFRQHAKATDVPEEVLVEILELLWRDGLVQKAAGPREAGPGFVLTDKGRRVLADPALLDRLRNDRPLDDHDPGAVVRSS